MTTATQRTRASIPETVTAKLWLRSCPKCQGDLYEETDLYGRYIACLQCAYYLSEADEVLLKYLGNHSKKLATRATAPNVKVLVGAKSS